MTYEDLLPRPPRAGRPRLRRTRRLPPAHRPPLRRLHRLDPPTAPAPPPNRLLRRLAPRRTPTRQDRSAAPRPSRRPGPRAARRHPGRAARPPRRPRPPQHHRPRPGAAGAAGKKKVQRAAEHDRPDVRRKRAAFRTRARGVDPDRYLFLDETGAHTALTRRYGRAPRGQRLYEAVPQAHWRMTTLVAAIRRGGVTAPLVFEG